MKEKDIYNRIINSFRFHKPLNAKDIKDVISKYLKFHNLNDYVRKIIFNNEEYNLYDYDYLEIMMDYHNQSIDEYNVDNFKSYLEYEKLDILNTILHELTHAEQEYFYRNSLNFYNNKFINDEFLLSRNFNHDDFEKYIKYHDFLLLEYYAFIRSSIKIEKICLQFLKDYISNEGLVLYNSTLAFDLFDYYLTPDESTISYPLYNNHIACEAGIDDNFLDDVRTLSMKKMNNLDKILMGLPIDGKVLKYIDDVKNGKVKTISLFDDIKKIGN